MNAGKNTYIGMIFISIVMAGMNANAATVNYTLENVTLGNNAQMTGAFSWTYDIGDFENGVGQFRSLVIPWTSHNQDDLNATFDIGSSIEITLEGNFHDDGIDISLFLLQPLTPTTSSSIDPDRSKYEIGGNGFHDGPILHGSISPFLGDVDLDGDVDSADLNLLLSVFESPPNSYDEFNLDSLLANFGLTDIPQGNPVPEPTSLALLLSGAFCLLSLRRRE